MREQLGTPAAPAIQNAVSGLRVQLHAETCSYQRMNDIEYEGRLFLASLRISYPANMKGSTTASSSCNESRHRPPFERKGSLQT